MEQIPLTIALLFITLQGCSQQAEQDETNALISSKHGIDLTEAQFNTYLQLAEGHNIVRQKLGGDIGEMNFDSDAANNFREFMTNTLLTAQINSHNSSYNSSDYTDSNASIQFCANGTFTEAISGHVSVQVEDMSSVSSGTSYLPGYWEVAALPNGMFIILMYSDHPSMLEDSPNGFLPFIVAQHAVDFVAMPSGDLYRRTADYHCN